MVKVTSGMGALRPDVEGCRAERHRKSGGTPGTDAEAGLPSEGCGVSEAWAGSAGL